MPFASFSMTESGRTMTVNGSPSTTSSSMTAFLPPNGGAGTTTEATSIKVFCRLRQQNQLEKREGATEWYGLDVVDGRTIFLRNERCDVDEIRCTFDRVFDVDATQEEVYEHTAKPLVSEFLQGYNCTIFAYGQTGSGKTHTILGPKDGVLVKSEEEGGIISRVVKGLYKEAEKARTITSPASGDTIELTVSFVEIYMEQICDLLASSAGNGSSSNTVTSSASSVAGGLKICKAISGSSHWMRVRNLSSSSQVMARNRNLSSLVSTSLSSSSGQLLEACASNTDATPCVHRVDAEALSRQIVELKLQLHYLTESTKQSLDGETYAIVIENAKLKTRIEEFEFQANLSTVTCNQLEMKNRACETRLSNQETHIGCIAIMAQVVDPLGAGSSPFGLWRGFESMYKSTRTPSPSEVEIKLSEKVTRCSSPSPLQAKMLRPIVKPIAPSSTSFGGSSGSSMSQSQPSRQSFSPWIVNGFETSHRVPLLARLAQDATLDELAAPMEIHGEYTK
ncbi:Kinesin-like protein, partial [Globisporangium splendens]